MLSSESIYRNYLHNNYQEKDKKTQKTKYLNKNF